MQGYRRAGVASSNALSEGHRSLSVGLVGVGLMGTSIAACLLAHNQKVFAVEADGGKRRSARRRVLALLHEMRRERLLRLSPVRLLEYFHVSVGYAGLAECDIVIESITES